MSKESQLDQTQRLLGAVMGSAGDQSGKFDDVKKAFGAGKIDIVIELPWYPDGSTHQLILTRLTDDHVYFINPLGHGDAKAGTALLDGSLPRRVEDDNTESATLADFEKLFRGGKAKALIPR